MQLTRGVKANNSRSRVQSGKGGNSPQASTSATLFRFTRIYLALINLLAGWLQGFLHTEAADYWNNYVFIYMFVC